MLAAIGRIALLSKPLVIFCTLVGQALSLTPLIRWLGIHSDDTAGRDELAAREHLSTRTLAYLASPAGAAHAPAEVLDRMRARYDIRLERLRNRAVGIQASRLDEKPAARRPL